MTGSALLRSAGVMRGRRLAWYVTVASIGFAALFLLTRSSILIGDASRFIYEAGAGDPAHIHYAEPSHFLQVPLARAIWLGLAKIGVAVNLTGVSIAISLAGTLTAIVCFGLIAAEVLAAPEAAWIGALLFGTSLHIFTQWNGELYGLALGFVTVAIFRTLHGRVVLPALLWSLSILSHSDFVFAAPVLTLSLWLASPDSAPIDVRVRRAAVLLGTAAASTSVALLSLSWTLAKWTDAASLAAWLRRSYDARQADVAAYPEVGRALKGLLTAYTVAGHFWRDILTRRGAGGAAFTLAAGVGLLVIAATGVLLAASVRQRRVLLFGLTWLVPFHVLVNWWFVPTVEKYHAGALPGFVLLVTGGLVTAASRLSARKRLLVAGGYVTACAGLNLFAVVLPMQALGRDTVRAAAELRLFSQTRGGRAVFIACDDSPVLVDAGTPFFRVRSVWSGSVQDIQQALVGLTKDRLREGKEPYLVGRWCLPEEWKTTSSKAPFDLFFLEQSFNIVPTGITGIPIAHTVPTNPFTWTRGDVIRLEPRSGS